MASFEYSWHCTFFSSSVILSSFLSSRLVGGDTYSVNATILVASWLGNSACFRLLSSRSSLRSSMMLSASDSLTISATRNAVTCWSSAVSHFLDLGPIAFGWMRPHPGDYATTRWRLGWRWRIAHVGRQTVKLAGNSLAPKHVHRPSDHEEPAVINVTFENVYAAIQRNLGL